jgi:large subunit ribosomal protein L25
MSVTIKTERRERYGKGMSRKIRREGMLPVILYGPNTENIPLIMNKKDVFRILKSESGENTLFKVAFDSEKRDVMIKELQQDVVSDEILHVDLIQIALDKKIRVTVPLVLVGDAVGVKTEGGFVDFMTRELEIECLPKDIPEHIDVDISELHLNQSVKVEDIPRVGNVEFASDPQTVLVHVLAQKAEEIEEEIPAEEEEIIAGEAEPEVIKKEKSEEEKQKEAKE